MGDIHCKNAEPLSPDLPDHLIVELSTSGGMVPEAVAFSPADITALIKSLIRTKHPEARAAFRSAFDEGGLERLMVPPE